MQASFLECGDVDIKPFKLGVNYCSLFCVTDVLEALGEVDRHGTAIPTSYSMSCYGSFSLNVALCKNFNPYVKLQNHKPHIPCEAAEL